MRQLIIEHGITKTLKKEKVYDIKWHEDFKIVIGKYLHNRPNGIHIFSVENSINSSVQKKVLRKNKI